MGTEGGSAGKDRLISRWADGELFRSSWAARRSDARSSIGTIEPDRPSSPNLNLLSRLSS